MLMTTTIVNYIKKILTVVAADPNNRDGESYQWSRPTAAAFDQRLQPKPLQPYKVVAIDFGIKRAILERLSAHGCDVQVLPASANFDQVMAHQPDGVFLSNGPGDPAVVSSGIELATALIVAPLTPSLKLLPI